MAGRNSILIVEESTIFRESLAAALNSLPDFTVVGEVGLVRKALEIAKTLKPDIILMAAVFSDGNGLDAIGPILEVLPRTKIVVLSMYDSDELLIEAISCGAMGYLLKDIHLSALVESIRALVRGEVAISRSHVARALEAFNQRRMHANENGQIIIELTRREREVIREIERGATNREIAEHLTISENTVKRHIHSILKKLNLRNRREVAKYVQNQGL